MRLYYKHETASRPSYLYTGNPYQERRYLYWKRALDAIENMAQWRGPPTQEHRLSALKRNGCQCDSHIVTRYDEDRRYDCLGTSSEHMEVTVMTLTSHRSLQIRDKVDSHIQNTPKVGAFHLKTVITVIYLMFMNSSNLYYISELCEKFQQWYRWLSARLQ